MIRIASLCLGVATLASVATALPAQKRAEIEITARPVPLEAGNPGRTRVGGLRFLGGWVLSSGDKRFGGISSLISDRGRFTALTDKGVVLNFRMVGRKVVDARAFPLPAVPVDTGGRNKTDSESMTRYPATGHVWVGFEGANAVWRYEPGFAASERWVQPQAMADWPGNGGPEAMARLKDGRFLILSEEAPGATDGTTAALLYDGDPTIPGTRFVRVDYRAPEGYRVTDATALPDGRLVLLHRRFTVLEGMSSVIGIADPPPPGDGGVIAPREIARLAPPLTVDNMEALTVEDEGGRTILWIASDDNFSGAQRTLLLKFALDAAAGAAAR